MARHIGLSDSWYPIGEGLIEIHQLDSWNLVEDGYAVGVKLGNYDVHSEDFQFTTLLDLRKIKVGNIGKDDPVQPTNRSESRKDEGLYLIRKYLWNI